MKWIARLLAAALLIGAGVFIAPTSHGTAYTTVSNHVSVPAHSTGKTAAYCSDPYVATGGGFVANGLRVEQSNVATARNGAPASGWAVVARNGSSTARSLTATAVCVSF